MAGGAKAVQESTDPMILLAKMVDQPGREARRRYESQAQSIEREAYSKIAKARFAIEGTSVYPDATFTLRLSYGAVKGYIDKGKEIKPYTDFAGLFERSTKFGGKKPYELPERWHKKKSNLNLSTQFNMISTNDIIGGNSGSPLINRNAELVGLIFDGNIQSLVGDFIYDETLNRAVAVDVRGMTEALRNVYDAKELLDELSK